MTGKIVDTENEGGENHGNNNHEKEAQENLPDRSHDIVVQMLKGFDVLVIVTDGSGHNTDDETQQKLVVVLH
jgi:hypothetical protein